jgi:hypothetical protein
VAYVNAGFQKLMDGLDELDGRNWFQCIFEFEITFVLLLE